MPRRKPIVPKTLPERNEAWEKTGLPTLPDETAATATEKTLPELLGKWIDWLGKQPIKRPHEMYCFIYYDIEHNKIRRLVARLLEKEGCIRVQKSVFFARLHRRRYRELADLLKQIQQLYDNKDSIMLLPVGEDMLNSLQCIGQSFDLELLTAPKNTIFV